MGIATFRRNQVVQIDGRPCRLLRRVDDDSAWLLDELPTGRTRTLADAQWHRLYREGKLTLIVPGVDDRVVNTALAAGLNERNFRWEMAKVRRSFVLAVEAAPNFRDAKVAAVRDLWEKLGRPQTFKRASTKEPKPPTLKAISQWRKRFIEGGRDALALLDRTANSGNRTRRMGEDGMRLVRKAIEEVYMTPERPPVKAAWEEAVALIEAENAIRADKIELPSEKLVRKTLHDDYDRFDIDVARYGRDEAIKRYRAVLKHHDGLRPNGQWQIDHTVLDVIVIDDRIWFPMGRPCIAIALDSCSRSVTGIHISFYPPGQVSLYGCLKEAVLPKDWVKESYPEIEHDWYAMGLPDEILIDRAMENFANGLFHAMGLTGVVTRHTPRKMPWLKPFIERFNGTLSRDLIKVLPGTTFSNVLEKMGYDPAKHAVIKYSVLRKLVYKWIIDVYHHNFHRTLQTTPAEQWKLNIRPEEIRMPASAAHLSAILGRRVERVLTHKGIELEHLLYNSRDLQKMRQKLGSKLRVTVSVDDANIGAIVVFNPETSEPVIVPAIRSEYAEGLTLDQHRAILAYVRRQFSTLNILTLIKAKHEIREMIRKEMAIPSLKTRKRLARLDEGNLLPQPITIEVQADVSSTPAPDSRERLLVPVERLNAAMGSPGVASETCGEKTGAASPDSLAAPAQPVQGYQPITTRRVTGR